MQTDRARAIFFLLVLALVAPHRAAVAAQYFVNDLSIEGDVYCTAPGRSGGYGTTPGDPQLSLEAVFRVYDLLPGDIVYVDTGVFANSANLLVGAADAGQEGSPVTILGSTNRAAGGTVLAGPETGAGQPVLVLDRASHVHVYDIDVRGGAPGVVIRDSSACLLERCSAAESQSSGISISGSSDITLDTVQAYANAGHGIGISGSTFRIVDGLFVQNAGRGVSASPNGDSRLESSTIAGNADTQVYISSSQPVHLRNCILVSSADHVACLYTSDPAYIDADYNDYWTTGLARIARHGNDIYMTIEDWRAASGGDANSLSHDPLFADADALDYHLRSTAGRFVPPDSWTSDGQHSPCIDAGDPAAAFDEEPEPNGSRANLGAYSQGPEASKSSEDPRLLAVSLNNGGKVSGSVQLEWRAFNVDPRVDGDGPVRTRPGHARLGNRGGRPPAEPGVYAWDTTSVGTGSPFASWRDRSGCGPERCRCDRPDVCAASHRSLRERRGNERRRLLHPGRRPRRQRHGPRLAGARPADRDRRLRPRTGRHDLRRHGVLQLRRQHRDARRGFRQRRCADPDPGKSEPGRGRIAPAPDDVRRFDTLFPRQQGPPSPDRRSPAVRRADRPGAVPVHGQRRAARSRVGLRHGRPDRQYSVRDVGGHCRRGFDDRPSRALLRRSQGEPPARRFVFVCGCPCIGQPPRRTQERHCVRQRGTRRPRRVRFRHPAPADHVGRATATRPSGCAVPSPSPTASCTPQAPAAAP